MYGECLMRMGRNEAALAEFNAVYAKDPSAPVLAKLAELQIHKGNSKEAIRMIETSEHKDDTTVQFALAKARIATYDQEKAREVLERLIRANRYHAGYYHYRGMSWYQERNYAKAKKDFDQALKYNPDYMEVGLPHRALPAEGGPHQRRQELLQGAFPAFEHDLAGQGLPGPGDVVRVREEVRGGRELPAEVRDRGPSAEASAALAKVLLKMRKPGDAERMRARPWSCNPGLPAAVTAMADVLLAQNRKAEALTPDQEGPAGESQFLRAAHRAPPRSTSPRAI